MKTSLLIVCNSFIFFLGSWKLVLLTFTKLWNRNQCKMLLQNVVLPNLQEIPTANELFLLIRFSN